MTHEQQRAVDEIARLGQRLGARPARYFARITPDDVQPQRKVREQTAAVLERSRSALQVMTVEGRGGRAPEGYAIMPLDRLAELLELAAGRRFVPLHERIAERTSDEPIPDLRGASKLRQRGRAGRPPRRNVPAPEFPFGAEGRQGGPDAAAPTSGGARRGEGPSA